MTYHRPTFISERERPEVWVDGKRLDDGRWEDCGPTSVLMMVDAHTGGAKPAQHTLDEAERLRMAAGYGPLGGTNIQRLAATAVVKYKVNLPRYVTGFTAIWAALGVGKGGAVAGSMAAFGPGHRLSRWQPGFDGPHAVYVQRESLTGRVWWIDPLATGAYTGEWVTKDELARFFGRGIAMATILPVKAV